MGTLDGFFAGLRPVKKMLVSEWADTYRYLSTESSAEPGKWSTNRTPYLRQIMDDLSPTSPVNEVIVQKGVQLGFTESGLNAVGCYVDIDPCPIMYVMPTITLAEAISKDRVTPMIEHCPTLSAKIRPPRERDSGNTTLVKQFPGGRLILAGANSAASLRSRSIRVLIFDEVDAAPIDVDGEGSPLSLAKKRQVTFGAKRKTYILSTPTIKGVSVIEAQLERTEKHKYFVPCPHCGTMQTLEFENLRWPEGYPERAVYVCPHCGAEIEERYKTSMLLQGRWQPTRPENMKPNVRGYHINSLYSPASWMGWRDIAAQWEEAQGKESELKVFTNTVLAETYEQEGDAPAWEHLYNRREQYNRNTIPAAVAFLTCGVDVQRDRIELEVVGWAFDRVSYSVDYRVLLGDTAGEEVWAKLAAVLEEKFMRADGVQLAIRLMAVDSGYNTTKVYEFCGKYPPSRVIPTKGQAALSVIAAAPRAVDVNRAGKKIGTVKVWHIGVSKIKEELYGWLNLVRNDDGSDPVGYCHFPEYDQHYFKMLTAEKLVTDTDKRGYPVQQWTLPSGNRNEALDCRVYARAAAYVVGMDRFTKENWEQMRNSYSGAVPARPENRKRKSSFWD